MCVFACLARVAPKRCDVLLHPEERRLLVQDAVIPRSGGQRIFTRHQESKRPFHQRPVRIISKKKTNKKTTINSGKTLTSSEFQRTNHIPPLYPIKHSSFLLPGAHISCYAFLEKHLALKHHQCSSPSRYSTFTTTVRVKLLMKRPSNTGLEAEPAMKSPPWIHTMTGRGRHRGEVKLSSRGTKMLR